MNISFESVYKAISDNRDIKCLFLLNPTYYGACAQLEKIIKLCKDNNIKVLVDEAHGAHFPFHKELPPSSIELGADMAAISIHKTGGALTQASALLINNTVDDESQDIKVCSREILDNDWNYIDYSIGDFPDWVSITESDHGVYISTA